MPRCDKASEESRQPHLRLILTVVLGCTLLLLSSEILAWGAPVPLEHWFRIVTILITLCFAGFLCHTILRKEGSLQAEMRGRLEVEAALRQSEERMRIAIEASRFGLFDWDVTADKMVWSNKSKELLGLPVDCTPSLELLMAVVHPDDREDLQQGIKRPTPQQKDFVDEYRVVWPDGSVHWIWVKGSAYFDAEGRTLRRTGVLTNIDDRKRAEERLHLQAAALQAAANAIIITGRDGAILWTNRAFTEMTGYSAEEVIGSSPRVLKSGEQTPEFYTDLWKTILSGQIWHGEVVNRRKDGTLYIEEMTITPVRSERGEITHFVGVKQNVTQRKRRIEALRQAEEKYHAIFEDALVGIYQSTPDGRFLSVNPALARMCGYDSPEQQVAAVTDIVRDLYVDPACSVLFAQKMASDGMVRDFEHQIRRRDGAQIWLSQNARAVKDDHGELRYYEGTVQDITERKTLEAQLRQAQKMEAVGRLAGGVAHDFNNALGVILGYSDLLLPNFPAESTQHRFVEEIAKAARRAANLTQQLLAFSRKQTIQPTVLDLNAVVTDTDKMLRRLIGEDIDLIVSRASKLKCVMADRGQIEQVLMNLAVNARDAMPRGGKLIIETANVELDETYVQQHSYAKPGKYVALSVSDSGCGMSPEIQARIFEPFFTTKEAGKGTGLGLSMVYGIVKQSDGYISVYSEAGEGTTFRIYLPQVADAANPLAAPVAPKVLPRGNETILMVEDEESMRKLARGCLENSGYTVLEAANGEAAIDIVADHPDPIHLLLTDVIMPGMSGRALASTILRNRPEIKVLYMSGYTHDLITQHGVLASDVALLEKPFNIEVLVTKVRDVLDGKPSHALAASRS